MRFPGRTVWICFLIFTLVGVIFSAQFYVYLHAFGQQITWPHALKWMLGSWYIWGLICPGIFWASRRFGFSRDRWRRALAAHFSFGVLAALIHILAYGTWTWLVAPMKIGSPGWSGAIRYQLTSGFSWDVFCYASIVTVFYAIDNARRYRESLVRTSRLEAQLAQAQLEALRMQLHPHFLFNTLNAITALIRDDPRGAEEMVTRLSDLLRLALDKSSVPLIPLREELEFVEKYLEIQRVRFGDRLDVRLTASSESCDIFVPTFILQPVIENAVRHGLNSQQATCHVQVDTKIEDGLLVIRVSDTGPGLARAKEGQQPEGIGISNTKARLHQVYGNRAHFYLNNAQHHGCIASLHIPIDGDSKTSAGDGRI